jgi:hypothetical protein
VMRALAPEVLLSFPVQTFSAPAQPLTEMILAEKLSHRQP